MKKKKNHKARAITSFINIYLPLTVVFISCHQQPEASQVLPGLVWMLCTLKNQQDKLYLREN